MSVVRVKDGVLFSRIAPAGFVILSAISRAAIAMAVDLTITSACDGTHSGENDPHHRGEAYDVRSHDLAEPLKTNVLNCINGYLNADRFYGFLESPGTENEHYHFQVRKGVPYP